MMNIISKYGISLNQTCRLAPFSKNTCSPASAGASFFLSGRKKFLFEKIPCFCARAHIFEKVQGSGLSVSGNNGAYHNNFLHDQGYIALVTVLVIGAVMLSVGMAVVLNAINTGQGSLGEIKKESGIGFVESCVEDALMKINIDNALVGTIILPEGSCTVTINSQVGSNWDFTVAGTFDGYSKSVRVTATRDTKVTVNSWREI